MNRLAACKRTIEPSVTLIEEKEQKNTLFNAKSCNKIGKSKADLLRCGGKEEGVRVRAWNPRIKKTMGERVRSGFPYRTAGRHERGRSV